MVTKSIFLVFFGAFVLGAVILAGSFFIPWQNVVWGRLRLLPPETVTVVGEARTQTKTQIATFTAGVSVINDNKDAAVADVNSKMTVLIDAVKLAGVVAVDIRTQNLSVNQDEETYYEEGIQKRRPGQWRVSNSIEITLRNVDNATSLSDLLARSGATFVYGPNFGLDDTGDAQNSLLDEAMRNARTKADILATSSGKQVGKVVSVSEGSIPAPIFRMEGGGGGGGGVQPGSGTVVKSVSVTYELE